AGLRETERRGAADPAAAARDHADAAREAEPVGSLLFGLDHGSLRFECIRHCERSEAIHRTAGKMDCSVTSFLAMIDRVIPRSQPPPAHAVVPDCAAYWRRLPRPRCP